MISNKYIDIFKYIVFWDWRAACMGTELKVTCDLPMALGSARETVTSKPVSTSPVWLFVP